MLRLGQRAIAKPKVTEADGQVHEFEISPLLDYRFQQYARHGIQHALFAEQNPNSVYRLGLERI